MSTLWESTVPATCFVALRALLFYVNQPKAHIFIEVYDIVIITNVSLSRISNECRWDAGGGKITNPGKCGGVARVIYFCVLRTPNHWSLSEYVEEYRPKSLTVYLLQINSTIKQGRTFCRNRQNRLLRRTCRKKFALLLVKIQSDRPKFAKITGCGQ
jgi:hypothetical protein